MKQQYWMVGGVAVVGVVLLWWLVAGRGAKETTEPSYRPEAPVAQPTAPVQVPVETAKLEAVGNYKGSGTATRSFDGTIFTHTVTANIAAPAAGKFYEGWLVRKKPKLTFFSTGRMLKEGGVYKLTYTSSQNYPDYIDVVVTEETEADGLDGKPEAHVLEGAF